MSHTHTDTHMQTPSNTLCTTQTCRDHTLVRTQTPILTLQDTMRNRCTHARCLQGRNDKLTSSSMGTTLVPAPTPQAEVPHPPRARTQDKRRRAHTQTPPGSRPLPSRRSLGPPHPAAARGRARRGTGEGEGTVRRGDRAGGQGRGRGAIWLRPGRGRRSVASASGRTWSACGGGGGGGGCGAPRARPGVSAAKLQPERARSRCPQPPRRHGGGGAPWGSGPLRRTFLVPPRSSRWTSTISRGPRRRPGSAGCWWAAFGAQVPGPGKRGRQVRGRGAALGRPGLGTHAGRRGGGPGLPLGAGLPGFLLGPAGLARPRERGGGGAGCPAPRHDRGVRVPQVSRAGSVAEVPRASLASGTSSPTLHPHHAPRGPSPLSRPDTPRVGPCLRCGRRREPRKPLSRLHGPRPAAGSCDLLPHFTQEEGEPGRTGKWLIHDRWEWGLQVWGLVPLPPQDPHGGDLGPPHGEEDAGYIPRI